MSVFKDTNGREWRIRLTAPKLQHVREATKISLATPSGEGALAATADGEILTRVLWLLCGEQGEPVLKPDQFAEAVASGDVFEAASEALRVAIVDFTQPSQRELLQNVLETDRKCQEARTKVAMERLTGDELNDQVCQSFRVGLENTLNLLLTRLENVGGLLASPESIPTTPPSGNSAGQKSESEAAPLPSESPTTPNSAT